MTKSVEFLAFDLGAESGRVVMGRLGDRRLKLEEIHRFPTGGVRVLGHLHWDVLRLFSEMKAGMRKAVRESGRDVKAIGVDTWGVDFALLAKDGGLLGNPYHYRDSRTAGVMEEVFERVSRREVFEHTGIQFMEFNTLFQLYSMVRDKSPLLDAAETLVLMPGLFNYLLTGRKVTEFSDATTTQFYDPRRKEWSKELFDKLGMPYRILPEIVPPGTVVGPLSDSVAEEVGYSGVPVVAPACHDTGSAVAAVPARGEDWAYLSSGTWSLMGTEEKEPIINDKSLQHNFTNEGGVAGTFRFLKNITGLWLVQECRRVWEAEGEALPYGRMTELAGKAKPFVSLVDPDDESFLRPPDMPGAIAAYCRKTSQPEPQDRGAMVRCALESLALKYRWTFERLEEMRGRRLEVLHIMGGGCRNVLLNRFTANAIGRPVVAGPIEATAMGNILMQAVALGLVGSIEELREIVRNSFSTTTYAPREKDAWEEAYDRFRRVILSRA